MLLDDLGTRAHVRCSRGLLRYYSSNRVVRIAIAQAQNECLLPKNGRYFLMRANNAYEFNFWARACSWIELAWKKPVLTCSSSYLKTDGTLLLHCRRGIRFHQPTGLNSSVLFFCGLSDRLPGLWLYWNFQYLHCRTYFSSSSAIMRLVTEYTLPSTCKDRTPPGENLLKWTFRCTFSSTNQRPTVSAHQRWTLIVSRHLIAITCHTRKLL